MLKLAGFTDEIGPTIEEQIQGAKANGLTHIEIRNVDKVNISEIKGDARAAIKKKLDDAGLGVCSIGSPIGKVAVDKPWQEHLDKFKFIVEQAQFFGAPLIRVFSYYPAGGEGKGPLDPIRDEVLKRFREKVAYIQSLPVTLVHENEKGIYGDIGRRCEDLMKSIDSPKLRCAFDFANFVQCGDDPQANWPLLKAYTAHIHIKDAIKGSGKVVPAGQGDGGVEPILVDAYKNGYRGFVSLEPHLKVAGHSHGETGADLFKVAADALKTILKRNNIPLES
jgi:sugar phosphate isomerase/epimerase